MSVVVCSPPRAPPTSLRMLWSTMYSVDCSLPCASPTDLRCSSKSAFRPCRDSPISCTSPTSFLRCSLRRSSCVRTSCVAWSRSVPIRSARSLTAPSRPSACRPNEPSSSRMRSEASCISVTAPRSFDCDWSAASASCAKAVSLRTACSFSDWIFSLISWSAAALLRTAAVISMKTLLSDSRISLISLCICCCIAAPCLLKSDRSVWLDVMALRIMLISACI
mmetsp:Transcript_75890/g.175980  ORF Transcript_75890/g.175980 Transcript_75890/m.175980 type:complete len:222 (+) Transcript_75890:206-871(+)